MKQARYGASKEGDHEGRPYGIDILDRYGVGAPLVGALLRNCALPSARRVIRDAALSNKSAVRLMENKFVA